jgi:N6-L-threonylcarbamoyladenine synthase
MRILGIESSCDETAAAVVEDGCRILSNVIASQFDLHRPFGGVVPEVAARSHAEQITAVIDEALIQAQCQDASEKIDAISVVNRPGLVGSLLVGISAAKTLALAWNKPLIGVDHIQGHVYASVLAGFTRMPHIALIVSGGHTSLYRVDAPDQIEVIGQTADDAAGEAFDKVAKMLKLGFPGGPALSKLASHARPENRKLFKHISACCYAADRKEGLDFSFSGLKTAAYYHMRGTSHGRGVLRDMTSDERIEVAGSFEEAACEIMVAKTLQACTRYGISAAAIGGGVACNTRLRTLFSERASRLKVDSQTIDVFFPPPILCTDNAAMNAGLAYPLFQKQKNDTRSKEAFMNMELDADPTPQRLSKTLKRG